MKKYLIPLTMILATPGFSNSGGEPLERISKEELKVMSEEQLQDRLEILEARVLEIEQIDRDALSKQDRKEVKGELRYIKKEMKAIGNGGIYISTGAIIIILLLIILL